MQKEGRPTRHSLRARLGIWGVLIVSAASLHATPIVGRLSIRGTVTLAATTIDFLPVGTGTGAFLIDPSTQSGSFLPFPGGAGAVKDLSSVAQPVGVPFLLVNFLVIAADPGTAINLTFINPGVFPSASCGLAAAVGQTCTPAGSPFNFVNTAAGGSVVSFTMLGTVVNGADTTAFVGTLTTQFSDMTYQAVLATIAGGGSVSAAYSADFDTTALPPDPD
jgi:hypothetical protein